MHPQTLQLLNNLRIYIEDAAGSMAISEEFSIKLQIKIDKIISTEKDMVIEEGHDEHCKQMGL